MVSQESVATRQAVTGLETLVKALQEEAVVLRGDLAAWKSEATSAAQENAILKDTISKLKIELEGWKDRAAMSAGKGIIVARRQLEDFAKQVKTLSADLQKAKEEATEHEVESSKLRKENEGLKAELNEWMLRTQAALKDVDSGKSKLNSSIKTLEADLEMWKQLATSGDEGQPRREELEHLVRDLRAQVEEWEKSAKIEHIGTKLVQSANGLEVQRGDTIEECNVGEVGERFSIASDSMTSNEWRDGPSELETSLQVEIEELKKKISSSEQLEVAFHCAIEDLEKKVIIAEKESEQLRLHYESRVSSLQVEVEAWKKRAACIADDGKHDKLDLEKKLKESLLKVRDATDFVAVEQERCAQELASVQAELKDWKVIAADASDECSSLRVAFDGVIKELQTELVQWKEKAESMSEETNSVKAELVQWKEKAESMIGERNSLNAELVQWKDKAESMRGERNSVKAELVQWKEKAEGVSEEKNSVKAELVQWKEKAESMSVGRISLNAELVQWKEKAESMSEERDSLKAVLEKEVESLENQVTVWKEKAESALEGVAKTQEYADLVQTLDLELCLWRQKTQEGKSLQLELEKGQLQLEESLTMTRNELQHWKDRAGAVTRIILSPEEHVCDVNEGDDDFLSVLESQCRMWKSKAQGGESLQLELKNALAETQRELREWKQKAAAVTLATESLNEELVCVIEEGRLEKEELNESINELESRLFVWRERAQECESLQTQLMSSQAELKEWKEKLKGSQAELKDWKEKLKSYQSELKEWKEKLKSSQAELKEWKDKALTITLTTRSLLEELDFRIEEGLHDKQEFCNSISALKESVLGWKAKATENESMVFELNGVLLETQTALREWKDRATSVSMATESLKSEIDCTLEDYRLEKEELCRTINDLEAEVYEWKARAQDNVIVQRQLERELSEMERKKRPLLRAHKSGGSG